MRLLCPECCSEEVGPHPGPGITRLRCANCGAAFEREDAHVTLAEAESRLPDPVPEGMFELDAGRARAELRDPDGAICVVDPSGDADERHRLLYEAQSEGIVHTSREGAWISVCPLSTRRPESAVVVDSGHGPSVLGAGPQMARRDGEDPITFTIRLLEGIVAEANRLAAGRAADSERLDRIAAFLDRPGQWSGFDVCQFVAAEIAASGRRPRGAGW